MFQKMAKTSSLIKHLNFLISVLCQPCRSKFKAKQVEGALRKKNHFWMQDL